MSNRRNFRSPGAALACAIAACVAASASAAPPSKPKLIVAISVDQFSADLFAEHRAFFTAGLKRLQQGIVFPSGYQGHAATETCPGHSTILTGARPARTGVIANSWTDQSLTRADKTVYCAEDPTAPGSSSSDYVVSPAHLRVPTLGDRIKAADPAARVVAVAGKDRAAVMMGGHVTDQLWFYDPKRSGRFVTLADRTAAPPTAVIHANAALAAAITRPRMVTLSLRCRSYATPVALPNGATVGVPVARRPGADAKANADAFRTDPAFDAITADLAIGLIRELGLGTHGSTDLIAIGLSATDYVGHSFGTEGAEMCAQLETVDAAVGRIMAALDAIRIPYAIVLTADHGGHDAVERNRARAAPDAERVDPELTTPRLNAAIRAEFGLTFDPLRGGTGELYIDARVPAALRPQLLSALRARVSASAQVETVISAEELRRMPSPGGPPDEWSLPERYRASYDPERSPDLFFVLKPRVTPIASPGPGSVATHGSPWNYDRRVPILFYWPSPTGFEQPLPIETADIAPTLASLIGLAIPADEIDGRCRDLDAGPGDSCASR